MTEIKKSLEEINLENYIFNKVKEELESWGNSENKNDIYVVSFFINHDNDELPILTVDYNTFKIGMKRKKIILVLKWKLNGTMLFGYKNMI